MRLSRSSVSIDVTPENSPCYVAYTLSMYLAKSLRRSEWTIYSSALQTNSPRRSKVVKNPSNRAWECLAAGHTTRHAAVTPVPLVVVKGINDITGLYFLITAKGSYRLLCLPFPRLLVRLRNFSSPSTGARTKQTSLSVLHRLTSGCENQYTYLKIFELSLRGDDFPAWFEWSGAWHHRVDAY